MHGSGEDGRRRRTLPLRSNTGERPVTGGRGQRRRSHPAVRAHLRTRRGSRLCRVSSGTAHEWPVVAVEKPEPIAWRTFMRRSDNPRIPTFAEAMDQALTTEETARLTAHLRPQAETGTGRRLERCHPGSSEGASPASYAAGTAGDQRRQLPPADPAAVRCIGVSAVDSVSAAWPAAAACTRPDELPWRPACPGDACRRSSGRSNASLMSSASTSTPNGSSPAPPTASSATDQR